jgi:hypothetical protein
MRPDHKWHREFIKNYIYYSSSIIYSNYINAVEKLIEIIIGSGFTHLLVYIKNDVFY